METFYTITAIKASCDCKNPDHGFVVISPPSRAVGELPVPTSLAVREVEETAGPRRLPVTVVSAQVPPDLRTAAIVKRTRGRVGPGTQAG